MAARGTHSRGGSDSRCHRRDRRLRKCQRRQERRCPRRRDDGHRRQHRSGEPVRLRLVHRRPQHLPGAVRLPARRDAPAGARDRLHPLDEPEDVDVQPAPQRQVLERRPDDVCRRQVLVRPGAEDQGRPGHLHPALVPQEHVGQRAVHGRLPLDGAGLRLALHPLDERRLRRRQEHVPEQQDPGEHRYGPHDRHGAVRADEVHAGSAGGLRPELALLGPEAEERRADHQLLHELGHDEAGPPAEDARMAFQTFTPTEIAAMGKNKSLTVHSGHGVVIRYLVFNVKRPPFNNINVRKAIAYLMPRQTIATRVYHGTVEPLYSMVPKGLPGQYDAYKSLYGASPNLAKAKAAMKGLKTPMPITLWWTPTHYGGASSDEYVEIQRALDASGLFKVTLKSAEWAQYSGALGKVYGAFQLGWFPDYPDADDYTVSFYQTNSFYNNGYSNKTMDKLIAKERAATTDASRYSYLKQMQILGAQTLPTIPYWQGNMIAVSQKSVQGIDSTLDAAYYMRFWLISK